MGKVKSSATEIPADVEKAVEALSTLLAERRDLQEIQRDSCAAIFSEMKKLKAQRDVLDHSLNYQQTLLKEIDPDAARDLDDVGQRIADLQEAVRRRIRELPAEQLSEGIKITCGDLFITVNRTTPVVVYDAKGLLGVYPDLADMSIDGDPVVQLQIDGNMMARLIEDGVIDEETAAAYRTVAKARNPAITFREGGNE